jgi:hypothetical protein
MLATGAWEQIWMTAVAVLQKFPLCCSTGSHGAPVLVA